MRGCWKKILLGAMAMLGFVNAHAIYTISLTQVGSDVVMSGSGQINTTGMTSAASVSSCSSRFDPPGTTVCLGTGNYGLRFGGGITGAGVPSAMGTLQVFGSSATGAPLVISTNDLYLPAGYVSNSPITNSVTFVGRTLATMGAVVGTYTMTLTSGDTIVVNVGGATPASVSVPTMDGVGALALALMLLTGGYFSLRRRRE